MKIPGCKLGSREKPGSRRGSILVIVLWITFGLISLAIYFGGSMNFELRASDNRAAAQATEQAIEGAARYVTYLLANQIANGSNGTLMDPSAYSDEAVTVGDCHFWIIGRDTNYVTTGPGRLCFGLIDEASKLNLNALINSPLTFSNQIIWLPRMTFDLAQGILDWRDTNGNGPTVSTYASQQPSYFCKSDPFETVDELRMVYGADMDTLVGEDMNRNGVLDPNETDENGNNMLDPGVLEYFTVYSRETNTATINLSNLTTTAVTQLNSLLETNLGSSRAAQIMANLGLSTTAGTGGRGAGGGGGGGTPRTPRPTLPGPRGPRIAMAPNAVQAEAAQPNAAGPGGGGAGGAGGRGGAGGAANPTFAGPLAFYVKSGMTSAEFALIATNLTTTTNTVIEGRVNINTASAAVLTCLMGGDDSAAAQAINYRLSNPNNLTSIAWISDAVAQSFPDAMQALEAGDYITTQSFVFTADVAAVGPHGRGYRRVKFVFDTTSGVPDVVYRQDLTHLGWALGKDVRQNYVLSQNHNH